MSHNLSQAPEFMIVTSYSVGDHKAVYHAGIGPTRALLLNADNTQATSDRYWNDTAPTNSEFTLGDLGEVNGSGRDCIAYLWHSVPGYSAFGSYQGNGNADGPFCFTGFRVGWLLVKSTTTGAWWIMDSTRDTYNPCIWLLYPDKTDREVSHATVAETDYLSNGFKLRNNWSAANTSGQTYIYAAFAEHPLGGGNVSPSPAR